MGRQPATAMNGKVQVYITMNETGVLFAALATAYIAAFEVRY